jgi:hypothetical protein
MNILYWNRREKLQGRWVAVFRFDFLQRAYLLLYKLINIFFSLFMKLIKIKMIQKGQLFLSHWFLTFMDDGIENLIEWKAFNGFVLLSWNLNDFFLQADVILIEIFD